mgnify:CR=1 FL=1
MSTGKNKALINGSESVFNEVFETYWEKVYTYFVKKTKNTESAKDLTQLVFIKLWKYRDDISEEVPLNQQIFRKTKQILIDWLRQESRRRSRFTENTITAQNLMTDQPIEKAELNTDLLNAIITLPPKRKEIFELKHIYGYSYQEIANLMGISPKTVDNQLSKANLHLRKILHASIQAILASDILNR